jgi:hypothetical protein
MICAELAITLINHIAAFYTHGINSAWWYDLNCTWSRHPSQPPSSVLTISHQTDVFSAATVLVAHRNMGFIHERNSRSIQIAIDVISRMKESGKVLAANYLDLLKKLQHQTVTQKSGSPHLRVAPEQSFQSDSQSFLTTDVGLDALLESTAFPWNLGSEILPSEDEFGQLFDQQ